MAEIKKINTELQLESALRDGNGSPGTNGQILSSTGTATDWISLSEIQGVDGTGTANYISKWSDTDTITNSIIFDNGTNVGIGTASPSTKLHTVGDIRQQGSTYSINITGGGTITGDNHLDIAANNSYLNLRSPNNNIYYRAKDNHAFKDASGSNEYLTIKTSGTTAGNVGIGTTSPSSKLHIEDSISDGSLFKITTTTSGSLQPVFDARIASNGDTYYDLNSYKSATKKIQIKSANTSYIQQVDGTGGFDIKGHLKTSLQTVNGGGVLQLHRFGALSLNDDASYAHQPASALYINTLYNTSTDYLMLLANQGSDKLAVDLQGNVGIGTISPSEKLEVSGNILTGGGSLNKTIGFKRTDGFNLDLAKIISNGEIRIGGTNVGVITFNQSSSEVMRIASNGNVGIGTTSPSQKLEVAGNVKLDGDNRHIYFGGNNTFIGERSNSTELELRGGGNSSAQTVYIDNSGRIGVGTSNPTNKLQLVYTDTHTSGDLALANSAFDIYNDSTADVAGKGSTLTFSDNYLGTNKTTRAAIKGGTDTAGNTADGFLAFYTDSGGANSMQQRMIIDNDGNVGIGNTNPTKELEIGTNAAAETEFRMHSDVSGRYFNIQSAGNFTSVKTTGSQNFILDSSGSSGYVTFVTNASERMRVNYNGNVGIGTTSPSHKLDVAGDIKLTNSNSIYWRNAANNADIPLLNLSSTNIFNVGTTSSSVPVQIALHAAGLERMRIDSSGNVGIGITSPSEKLDVAGNAIVRGDIVSRDTYPSIYVDHSGTVMGGIRADSTNKLELKTLTTAPLSFQVNSSEKMRITSAGNVGIGTTSPSKKLQVNGQTQFYEHSGANLTHQSTSNFSFDTLANNTASSNGGSVGAYIKLTATPPGATGIWSTFRARAYGENAKGNTDGMITFFSEYRNYTSTNAVTLGYHAGLYVNPLGVGGLATVTNNYGVYLNPGTSATNNYGVYQNGSSVKNFFQGNVGIGTTSPGAKLDVNGTTYLRSVALDSIFGYSGNNIQFTNSGNTTFNNSNVGIGTTSPSEKLHVFGGAAAIKIDSTTNEASLKYDNSTTTANIKLANNDLKTELGGTEVMRILANGNVGIGTTSPNAKLNVNGNVKIEGTNPLYFGGSGSVPNWEIKAYGSGGNDLLINDTGTNSGDLIFTGQDFGVGTTNPSEKLHVSGEPHPSIRLSSSSDSNYNVVINCGYRNEALNLSVGGYKVFTTEGYNTPETTHLYSNNSKALSLASNQAATFTSTVTATNFINSSDERLKENIEKVCNNSLDVQWKTFAFKSDRGQKRYGVIAQELEKTNPEFVREDAEGFKSVAYIDLLIAKIAELEERIQTLENK